MPYASWLLDLDLALIKAPAMQLDTRACAHLEQATQAKQVNTLQALCTCRRVDLIGMRPFSSLPLLLVWLQNPLVQDGIIFANAVRAIGCFLLGVVPPGF